MGKVTKTIMEDSGEMVEQDFSNSSAVPTPASTTPLPQSTVAHLTIAYVHLQYEETKTVVNKNGGAVAVAVIEGIALIAILAFLGYRTMVNHKLQNSTRTNGLYGYDNNNSSRITVPDAMRMSDIPPPRDPMYASPPTPLSQPTPARNTVMTTQELVVPTANSSAAQPSTTSNGQFNDPFATLESW